MSVNKNSRHSTAEPSITQPAKCALARSHRYSREGASGSNTVGCNSIDKDIRYIDELTSWIYGNCLGPIRVEESIEPIDVCVPSEATLYSEMLLAPPMFAT